MVRSVLPFMIFLPSFYYHATSHSIDDLRGQKVPCGKKKACLPIERSESFAGTSF